ncbi:hypothetical protein BG003_004798 [Podila horticola]|nr:hypothetical protein BG003_004798 [Podila horticola]
MKNSGRLYDIVDVIRDRSVNKWSCWPQLEQWDIVTERQGGKNINMDFLDKSWYTTRDTTTACTSPLKKGPMQQPMPPVPMASKVIAIPELHTEIASHLCIYHLASCALVSKEWHHFWNPYVWASIINRHPQDQHCARYGHLVRHFNAVLLDQGMHATAMTPISLDVVRQRCMDMKTVTLLSYSVSPEDFGRRIMDIQDVSPPTGRHPPGMQLISGVVPRVPNGFLSNTIQSLTLTLPYDVGRLMLHWIVLAGRQGQLQGLVQLNLVGVNIRSFEEPPKVSASDVQACPLLFPDMREFSTSLIVCDPEEDEGDMCSRGEERQSGLQTLSLFSLWSCTALPFILRPLHSLDSLTIGGTTVQPILAQIPRHCPLLTRFEYIGRFDYLGASLWIDFLAAYPRLTHLCLKKTDLADAVVLSLPRSCPSLQRLILPRQVSQITWQAVSALVENLAQLQVLNVEALTIPGEFFGKRMHQNATKDDEEGEGGGRGEFSEVVLKPWVCQNTLQELTLHNVFLFNGADDYMLFRQRIWSLRRLKKLGIFGEPIALECLVDVKDEAAKEAEKKRTIDVHPRFPCLESFNIPVFETPMGLAEAQALFGEMPRLREPKLPCASFAREAEQWFTGKYGETEDGDVD